VRPGRVDGALRGAVDREHRGQRRHFRSGTKRVQVNLEIEDGQVRERVRFRDDADDTDIRTEDGVVDDDPSGPASGDDTSNSGPGSGDDDSGDDRSGSGHGGDDDNSGSGSGRDHPEDD
jgi:hypothetical protein